MTLPALLPVAAAAVFALTSLAAAPQSGPSTRPATAPAAYRVLIFSKTAGFRHDSIPAGIAAVRALGESHGFGVDATEDADTFADATLKQYAAVLFLNTTGDILTDDQQAAFERYIKAGRGFVGVHAASDTEYGWPWYAKLVGAQFASHPAIQRATVTVEDAGHPATADLPAKWNRTDEWYNFRADPRADVRVLLSVDEATYDGGTMGDHPVAWCHDFGGGRAFYTALGHTKESYAEPLFLKHLLGGIEWAAGRDGKS